jgi:hypothetical protein
MVDTNRASPSPTCSTMLCRIPTLPNIMLLAVAALLFEAIAHCGDWSTNAEKEPVPAIFDKLFAAGGTERERSKDVPASCWYVISS